LKLLYIALISNDVFQQYWADELDKHYKKRERIQSQPTDLAGTSHCYENETRGDIIHFYNKIYVQKMQTFALRFAETMSNNELLLSPLPQNPNQIQSPKKVSEFHKIYIRSLEKNVLKSPSSKNCITYEFSKSPVKDSPAKDLIEINRLTSQTTLIKRKLSNDHILEGDLEKEVKLKIKIPKKLESLISDRQEQSN